MEVTEKELLEEKEMLIQYEMSMHGTEEKLAEIMVDGYQASKRFVIPELPTH